MSRRRAHPRELAVSWVVTLALFMTAGPGWTEGQPDQGRRASTATRVVGADFLKPVAGGLATVGGAALRYLPPGGRTWNTIHSQKGHLSRLGLDDAGARIL